MKASAISAGWNGQRHTIVHHAGNVALGYDLLPQMDLRVIAGKLQEDGIACERSGKLFFVLREPLDITRRIWIAVNPVLGWHYRNEWGSIVPLGDGCELPYEDLRDICLSLTRVSQREQGNVVAALSRLCVSSWAEHRRIAHRHPLYTRVDGGLRVASWLLGDES